MSKSGKLGKLGKRSAFLDPAKIDTTLAKIAGISAAQGVRVALAGGCALQLYGSPRFTQDVDIIAAHDLSDTGASPLRSVGQLSFGGRSMKTAGRNSVPVDVIVRNDQYANLYADALVHAEKRAGSPLLVVTLPYLAAMKLVADRGKDEQDLEFIICDSGVSYPLVRSVIKEHLGLYALDAIDATRDLALWRREK